MAIAHKKSVIAHEITELVTGKTAAYRIINK